jgi:hypothetical protein
LIVFSLKDFDINQGESFEEWEKEQILSNVLTRLRQISSLSIEEALSKQMINKYDSFPVKSDFYYPKHIREGVNWASIRIKGKERIIGYIEDNIFYLVFLDKDHRFWITEKKHT